MISNRFKGLPRPYDAVLGFKWRKIFAADSRQCCLVLDSSMVTQFVHYDQRSTIHPENTSWKYMLKYEASAFELIASGCTAGVKRQYLKYLRKDIGCLTVSHRSKYWIVYSAMQNRGMILTPSRSSWSRYVNYSSPTLGNTISQFFIVFL